MADLLSSWEATGDRRRIFLDCYSRMTRNMLAALRDGRFEDASWVDGLLRHFADYYFDALSCFDARREGVPLVWVHAHEAASNPGTTPMQNLLLGVNAHINFDLVFAISDILGPEWSGASAELRQSRYNDHCRVNTIISETVDEVQDKVLERFDPAMDIVDRIGGPLDEWAASWLIARWRENVWERAVQLMSCLDEDDRRQIRNRVESDAMERAHLLLLV